ncbi:MAG: triosephosphate isomerase [Marinobacter psychrophilus]|jgi:triosephosphate isomerase
MRRPLVVGNWKMNGSRATSIALVKSIVAQRADVTNAEMALCAPFIYLNDVAELLKDKDIGLGAQDVSVHLNGAYTGEVAASMLVDCDCKYAIVGHSERRQYHAESNLLVAQKALTAFKSGLTPIICLGESFEERNSDRVETVVGEQLQAVQSVLGLAGLQQSVIAYEPVWAIGTGLTATPEQAQDVHRFIRSRLGEIAQKVNIIYGGSVKSANAGELFAQKDIDGALVGGASLDAKEFIGIAAAG